MKTYIWVYFWKSVSISLCTPAYCVFLMYILYCLDIEYVFQCQNRLIVTKFYAMRINISTSSSHTKINVKKLAFNSSKQNQKKIKTKTKRICFIISSLSNECSDGNPKWKRMNQTGRSLVSRLFHLIYPFCRLTI